MKRYYVLLALAPLIALIVAEIAACVLWPGHPAVSLWYAPWTIAEYVSWKLPLDDYLIARILDWIATKQGQWPRSEDFSRWLQNPVNRDSWWSVYNGFLYAGMASGILWAGVTARFAWLYWRLLIRVGGVRVPPQAENQHVLHVGATQSGKTSLELQTLTDVRGRGDPAVVNDPSGEITKHLCGEAGRRDYILDLDDIRSVSWSPFAELAAGIKAELLAQQIIGEGRGHEQEWCNYAIGLKRDILLSLVAQGSCTNADLTRALLADNRALAKLVQDRPSAVHFSKGNDRYLGSVRSILATYTAPLFELDPRAGSKAFSIARHVQSLQAADGRGQRTWPWLFLKTRGGDLSDSQKQLLSCWMSLAVHRALSLPVNRQRRIWFAMEELGNLGAIAGLSNMLTQGAKYGVSAAAAVQSISQLEDQYGKERAQTILSCFNSVVVTRLADPQTAEYFERHFGKKEVVEWRRNEGSHGGQTSSSRSEQVRVRPKFYAHELMELDRQCITWIVGDRPRRRSVAKPNLPVIAETFVPRPVSPQPPSPPAVETSADPAASQPATAADGPQWKE